MPRSNPTQFNVRSAFARDRAHRLAKSTGMTVTQVVEDALAAYVPPGVAQPVGRLVRRGALLVQPLQGTPVSLDEANAALDRARDEG